MNLTRFREITGRYAGLRVAVVGDFFLDRYLHIDPRRAETSIETGLPVHNVTEVRSQPGAAGTIVNNLVALGVGEIHAVGFCGDDGEGYELRRALGSMPGVKLDDFVTSRERRTPVYCKPLLIEAGKAPIELSRLDSKNWTPTPAHLMAELAERVRVLAGAVDLILLLEQVEIPLTGVTCPTVNGAAFEAMRSGNPVVLADSRRGLGHFPGVTFKMNAAELARMSETACLEAADAARLTVEIARRTGRGVFVTLAERGMIGAEPQSDPEHVPAYPIRGEIDIVGAGDAVTANLGVALAAGAGRSEAMKLAMAAASIVIHQLGTTGTASPADLARVMGLG